MLSWAKKLISVLPGRDSEQDPLTSADYEEKNQGQKNGQTPEKGNEADHSELETQPQKTPTIAKKLSRFRASSRERSSERKLKSRSKTPELGNQRRKSNKDDCNQSFDSQSSSGFQRTPQSRNKWYFHSTSVSAVESSCNSERLANVDQCSVDGQSTPDRYYTPSSSRPNSVKSSDPELSSVTDKQSISDKLYGEMVKGFDKIGNARSKVFKKSKNSANDSQHSEITKSLKSESYRENAASTKGIQGVDNANSLLVSSAQDISNYKQSILPKQPFVTSDTIDQTKRIKKLETNVKDANVNKLNETPSSGPDPSKSSCIKGLSYLPLNTQPVTIEAKSSSTDSITLPAESLICAESSINSLKFIDSNSEDELSDSYKLPKKATNWSDNNKELTSPALIQSIAKGNSSQPREETNHTVKTRNLFSYFQDNNHTRSSSFTYFPGGTVQLPNPSLCKLSEDQMQTQIPSNFTKPNDVSNSVVCDVSKDSGQSSFNYSQKDPTQSTIVKSSSDNTQHSSSNNTIPSSTPLLAKSSNDIVSLNVDQMTRVSASSQSSQLFSLPLQNTYSLSTSHGSSTTVVDTLQDAIQSLLTLDGALKDEVQSLSSHSPDDSIQVTVKSSLVSTSLDNRLTDAVQSPNSPSHQLPITTEAVQSPTSLPSHNLLITTDTVHSPHLSSHNQPITTNAVQSPNSPSHQLPITTEAAQSPTSLPSHNLLITTDTVHSPSLSSHNQPITTNAVQSPNSPYCQLPITKDAVQSPTSLPSHNLITTDAVQSPSLSSHNQPITTNAVESPTSLPSHNLSIKTDAFQSPTSLPSQNLPITTDTDQSPTILPSHNLPITTNRSSSVPVISNEKSPNDALQPPNTVSQAELYLTPDQSVKAEENLLLSPSTHLRENTVESPNPQGNISEDVVSISVSTLNPLDNVVQATPASCIITNETCSSISPNNIPKDVVKVQNNSSDSHEAKEAAPSPQNGLCNGIPSSPETFQSEPRKGVVDSSPVPSQNLPLEIQPSSPLPLSILSEVKIQSSTSSSQDKLPVELQSSPTTCTPTIIKLDPSSPTPLTITPEHEVHAVLPLNSTVDGLHSPQPQKIDPGQENRIPPVAVRDSSTIIVQLSPDVHVLKENLTKDLESKSNLPQNISVADSTQPKQTSTLDNLPKVEPISPTSCPVNQPDNAADSSQFAVSLPDVEHQSSTSLPSDKTSHGGGPLTLNTSVILTQDVIKLIQLPSLTTDNEASTGLNEAQSPSSEHNLHDKVVKTAELEDSLCDSTSAQAQSPPDQSLKIQSFPLEEASQVTATEHSSAPSSNDEPNTTSSPSLTVSTNSSKDQTRPLQIETKEDSLSSNTIESPSPEKATQEGDLLPKPTTSHVAEIVLSSSSNNESQTLQLHSTSEIISQPPSPSGNSSKDMGKFLPSGDQLTDKNDPSTICLNNTTVQLSNQSPITQSNKVAIVSCLEENTPVTSGQLTSISGVTIQSCPESLNSSSNVIVQTKTPELSSNQSQASIKRKSPQSSSQQEIEVQKDVPVDPVSQKGDNHLKEAKETDKVTPKIDTSEKIIATDASKSTDIKDSTSKQETTLNSCKGPVSSILNSNGSSKDDTNLSPSVISNNTPGNIESSATKGLKLETANNECFEKQNIKCHYKKEEKIIIAPSFIDRQDKEQHMSCISNNIRETSGDDLTVPKQNGANCDAKSNAKSSITNSFNLNPKIKVEGKEKENILQTDGKRTSLSDSTKSSPKDANCDTTLPINTNLKPSLEDAKRSIKEGRDHPIPETNSNDLHSSSIVKNDHKPSSVTTQDDTNKKTNSSTSLNMCSTVSSSETESSLQPSPIVPRRKRKSQVPSAKTSNVSNITSDTVQELERDTSEEKDLGHSSYKPPPRPPKPLNYNSPLTVETTLESMSRTRKGNTSYTVQPSNLKISPKPNDKSIMVKPLKKPSLNPFDSDEDDEDTEPVPPVTQKTKPTKKVSLNPFDSDDDDDKNYDNKDKKTVSHSSINTTRQIPPPGYNPFEDDDDDNCQRETKEKLPVINRSYSHTSSKQNPVQSRNMNHKNISPTFIHLQKPIALNPFDEEEEDNASPDKASHSRETPQQGSQSLRGYSTIEREGTCSSSNSIRLPSSRKKRRAPLPPGFRLPEGSALPSTSFLQHQAMYPHGGSSTSLNETSWRRETSGMGSTLSLFSGRKKQPPPRPPPPKIRYNQ